MANPIITKIQIEGNDIVSFLNGTDYVRSMSQILPQSPTYISYRYDSITISQVGGDAFTFSIYTITDVGGLTFTALTIQDTAEVVQARTIEIYRLLVTSIFKGCCECGNTEPECSIQYTSGNGEDLGTFFYDSGAIRVNYTTANNQDFSGLWPIIQDGSWMFVFSKTDPTIYGVYQLSGYTDGGPGIYAQFTATLLNGPGTFPPGTELCLDVTSVGGSLVQDWQDTLNISSILTQDNFIDGGAFNFQWDNVAKYILNSTNFQQYTSDDGSGAGFVKIDPGAVTLNATGYIDIITPGYPSASTGWVLALDASGHVEYVEAGTGTISSIGLFMPPAFTVSTPNPLTSDGSFTVDGAGTALEYINGLGELATFPVYTVENGLHAFGGVPGEAPPDPYLFHLGGELVENTTITVTNGANQYALGVAGLAAQNTQQPFGVSNLGDGGVATFQDYGSSSRPNPSVEIVGDVDLYQPLLELKMEGNLPNPDPVLADRLALLRLKYDGDPALAKMSIDYQFKNDDTLPNAVYFIGCRLTAEVTDFSANNEQSKFLMSLFDGGSRQIKMEMSGPGQLTINEYATGSFSNGATNINNTLSYVLGVDNTGKVWKTSAGTGTVTSINGAGLITTSPNPITTIGTVTTSVNENRLVGRWDAAGTGIMQEITIGAGLSLSAGGELTADGSVPVYTVNNGLEPQTLPAPDPYNFQLGGPLVRNTIVTGGATPFNYSLNLQNIKSFSLDTNGKIGLVSELGNDSIEIFAEPNQAGIQYLDALNGQYAGFTLQGYSDDFTLSTNMFINNAFGGVGFYAGVDSTSFPYTENALIINTPNVSNGTAVVGQVLKLMSMTGLNAGKAEWQDGGGGTYDSDQGIYKDTSVSPETFMLGAPLGSEGSIAFQQDRYIYTDDFKLSLRGNPTGDWQTADGSILDIIFDASTSGMTAAGIKVDASAGSGKTTAIAINQGSGTSILIDGVGDGINLTSDGLPIVTYLETTSGLNTIQESYRITRQTEFLDPAISNGFGTGISFVLIDGNFTVPQTQGTIDFFYSDITPGTQAADMQFRVNLAGGATTTPSLTLKGSNQPGQIQFNQYGTGSITGTPAYTLGVDSLGNVIEIVGSGPAPGLQDVITTDSTLTANNTITGVGLDLKFDQFLNFEANATGTVKAYSFSGVNIASLEINTVGSPFVDIYSTQSGGGFTGITLRDTRMEIKTPLYTSKTAGDVLTLVDPLTGEAEWETPTGGGGIPFAVASGTDTYTATVSGVTAYTDGDAYLIRFTNGNTDSATLNINSLGAIPLHQNNQVPLIGGDIWNGGEMLCIYNATDNSFECIGTSPNSLFAYVTNVNGSTITKGQAVIAFGGVGNRMTVKLAQANNDANSAQTIGFVFSTSINDGQKGIIIIQGYFSGLNLFPPASGWLDGDPVYLSPTTAGAVTRTKPYAPNHLVYLGVVATANPGSSGRMYVRVQNGYELDELHNVQAQSPNLNDTIRYDTADSQWKTASVPSLSGTFSIGVTVDGSGGTITAGVKGYVRVPYACTINTWSILTGNSGVGATITFDIWRANNAIPTAGVSLVGGGTKPFLTSGSSQITSAAPSGWTSVTLAANDILGFNVETGAAVFSWANLQLLVTKS